MQSLLQWGRLKSARPVWTPEASLKLDRRGRAEDRASQMIPSAGILPCAAAAAISLLSARVSRDLRVFRATEVAGKVVEGQAASSPHLPTLPSATLSTPFGAFSCAHWAWRTSGQRGFNALLQVPYWPFHTAGVPPVGAWALLSTVRKHPVPAEQ